MSVLMSGLNRRACLQTGAVLLSLQGFLSQAQSAARRHALLIGVSALQHQPKALWLKGPVHDVAHMQRALLAHGFAAADINVLADDGQGSPLAGTTKPDRAGLLKAFKALTAKVRAGDSVVIYWSGHAVRASGPRKQAIEPDDKSTFLLGSDAKRLLASTPNAWPLRGAVADAELGAVIDDCLAAGAHVLAVMDVCHAASATRSSEQDVLWRGLRVSDLEELKPGPRSFAEDSLPAVLPAPRERGRGYVGLYACEDMQRTPEWSLHGSSQGAFTYAVGQALLNSRSSQRYADLARNALDVHTELAQKAPVARSLWPTPVFEGTLQAPLWRAEPMRRWDSAVKAKRTASSAVALPDGAGLQLHLKLPNGQRKSVTLTNGDVSLGRLPVGTQFELEALNEAALSLYLRIFHIGPTGRWQAIYPERAGDAALLPAASRGGASHWQRILVIDRAEAKPEALLWVLARADAKALIEDAEEAALPAHAWQMQMSWQAVAR